MTLPTRATAPKRARRRKPLADDDLLATMTPPDDILRATGPADAPFFDGRLPLGYLDMPLDKLVPRAGQPRTEFDDAALAELAASFGQGRGVLEPILCRPVHGQGVYEIVAGERRYRAAKLAGLHTVPAIARDKTDDEAALDAMIENVHRRDLSALEEARALAALLERFASAAELAGALGWDRQRLSNKLRVLKLNADILTAIDAHPARYSWRMLDRALHLQQQHGVEAAKQHLGLGVPANGAEAEAGVGCERSSAGTGTAAAIGGSGKPRPAPQASRGVTLSARVTRRAGVRVSLHASTDEDLREAAERLRGLADALERHVTASGDADALRRTFVDLAARTQQ